MTTAKKIKILNSQIDKLHPSEALLNIFYDINWRTETLEYIRVFLGENSEPYKRCKLYNDKSDEEHKTKNYSTGSEKWVLTYTELLFSCIGILQHDLYKKSKFAVTLRGVTLGGVMTIIAVAMTLAYYVGKWEGIALGKSSITPTSDTTHYQTQQIPQDSTTKKSKKQHLDSSK